MTIGQNPQGWNEPSFKDNFIAIYFRKPANGPFTIADLNPFSIDGINSLGNITTFDFILKLQAFTFKVFING